VAGTDVQPEAVRVSRSPRGSRAVWWAVLGIMVFSIGLECWALQRDLPIAEVDEATFVRPAVHIAATGDLNPHWFGHPGSTTIYPLAGLYHVWGAVAHGEPVLSSSPDLAHRFATSPGEFYVLGRLWSIAFATGAIPLIFLLGRRCFSTTVGLIGASLWALLPLVVQYGRIVRSDSAGVFFAVLALLLIVRLLDQPTLRNHVMAGLAVGAGVSSRYFLVTLLPVLVAAGVFAIRRNVPGATFRGLWAGVGAAVVGFVLTTPYFLLDMATARQSLAIENGPHPGHDGFSRLGNLRWYVGNAIPNTISWPVALLVVAGVVLVLVRRQDPRRLLLVGAGAVFLIGISTSELHWYRWPLPILPVVVLLAAYALVTAISALQARTRHVAAGPVVVVGLALVAIVPAKEVVELNLVEARPSTRVVAQQWIRGHVPPGAAVVRELKTAPLDGMPLRAAYTPALPIGGWTLDQYRQDGFQYLITNAGVSGTYTTHPRRYPTEAAFYRDLRRQACLLHEFRPSADRYGPIIRVYELISAGAYCPTGPHW
jgi:4-amino-4-deoxy-L-arabinose transferase-like glycosyltransferase